MAIGKGNRSEKRGHRGKGVTNTLPAGAVAAIKAANAVDLHDPTAQEALGVTLAVMRGEVKRGAMPRLLAARDMLDRRRGRPVQAVQLEGELVHRIEIHEVKE